MIHYIHYLSLEYMVVKKNFYDFHHFWTYETIFMFKLTVEVFVHVAYPDNLNTCILTTLRAYLDCFSTLHGGAQQ